VRNGSGRGVNEEVIRVGDIATDTSDLRSLIEHLKQDGSD